MQKSIQAQSCHRTTCPVYSGSYKIWDASLAERVFFPDYDSLTENDTEY